MNRHGRGRPSRVTVRDVAARAGVSVGTVSHVITGSRRVAPETRRRVQESMAALGYRPNRVARSLILQRTRTLAMVIPDVANPFFGDLVRGVEEVARQRGYSVLFGNSDNDPEQEARYLEEFLERRVDGLLLVVAAGRGVRSPEPSGDRPDGEAEEGATRGRLAELAAELPVVALDRLPATWDQDAVLVDNEGGMELVVRHLVDLGHRRLAFVGGDPTLTTGRDRRRGFLRALERRGLAPAWVSDGAFSLESGRAQMDALLASSAPPPTAVVAGNDLLALGALLAARERGLRVPHDLSVAGFDDIVYARLADPPLTTVRQPAREMGATAAHLVFRRIDGDESPGQRIVLRPELVVRASTAPLGRPEERRPTGQASGGGRASQPGGGSASRSGGGSASPSGGGRASRPGESTTTTPTPSGGD
jgi:LacI family transcriptional regulator